MAQDPGKQDNATLSKALASAAERKAREEATPPADSAAAASQDTASPVQDKDTGKAGPPPLPEATRGRSQLQGGSPLADMALPSPAAASGPLGKTIDPPVKSGPFTGPQLKPATGSPARGARSALAVAAPSLGGTHPGARPDEDEDAADAADGAGAKARRTARRRAAGPSRPHTPANDDVPSIGGLIFALHQKPSRRPMQLAAIASGVWALLGILLGWAMLAPELQRVPSFAELLQRPTAMTLAATILIPIALFWFLALLIWRAQELKLMSSAMTEVAIRLAEPDRMAEQQIASVGQAVRRQVSFMNEAVSRALGRAGELEALVHSEVAALDRAYSENEARIRSLLQDLSGERHALLTTSEQVNTSLRELGTEVPVLIDRLGEQQVKLAKFIEDAGQNLVGLETTLTGTATHLADRTQSMQSVFETFTEGLDSTIGARTEGLQTVLEEYTRALDATLENRQHALDSQLLQRTRALDDAFSERLKLFDDSVLRSTIAIDSTVADKARALSVALEGHAKEIGSVLGRQAGELDEQLMHGVNAVRRASENVTRQSIKAIEGLANQAELLKNVSENLVNQIGSVTNRFDSQGQTIMRAANALETANFRIDKTLQNRQAELAETLGRLTGKAEDIGRTLQGYTASLEGTMTDAEQRAHLVGENLARNAEERARQTLGELERLKSTTDLEASRTLSDLRARFSDSSEDMRQRAHRALSDIEAEQSRIREEIDRLPDATRANVESVRRSLQDQLAALEQLSSLSLRESQRRDVSAPLPAPSGTAVAAPRTISSVTQSLAEELGHRGRAPGIDARGSAAPADSGSALPAGPEQGMQPDTGWSLGDLLARASQDEENARQSADSAINIATIARALDATTASAIWSRFRAGQRGIMVRSIYTHEGREAFDEVQRRYAAAAPFRENVDRYMLDFEQLLREADARDASGRSAQGYIIADSGRVYLFLAHASGRLV